MANLENLNFAVILDDKQFNQQMAKVQAAADAFNTTMSNALAISGVKGGTENIRELVKELKNAEKAQRDLNAAVKAAPSEKIVIRHKDALTATNAKLFDTAKMLRTIGTLTGGAFSVYGLRRFLSTLIEVTGQFEVQKMALRTMLQDIDAADKIFQDLYRFSSNSTYRFSELAKYSKQLAAFNIGKDSLLETTKMLGDVASGVGVSMDRIILAYGHVKSSGFLRGIQLRSFSQNGVPVLDELAKMFSELENRAVSLGEVFDKMTRREIPFEMVEEAFKRMTSEGGKFYQMQEVLAKTLAGQINILKGRWENLMYAYGEANDGILKKLVSSVSNLIASSEEFGRFLVQLISTFGAYKVAQYIIIGLTDKMAFANLRLVKTFNALHLSNPYVAIAAGVAALTFVIIRQNKELSASEKITKALEDTTKKYDQALNSEIRELDLLYGALKSAKEGTDEYNEAKLAIEKRFDPYIQQLKNEGVEVNNLANIYDHLAERVKNASKERFLADAQSGISAAYGEAEQNAEDAFVRLLPRIKEVLGREATPDEEGALRHYIRTGGKNDLYKALASELSGAVKDVVMDINDPTGQTQRQTVRLTGQGIIDDLTGIKNNLDIASIAYTDAMRDAAKRFDAASRETSGVRPGDPRDWAKQVNSVLNTLDPEIIKKAGLGLKENEGYYEYLERVGKEYKQINEEKDKALSTDKASKELLLDAIRQVDAALEGNILSDVRYNKTPWKENGTSDDETKKQIQSLNKQASILHKYKDAYDSLEPFLGEDTTSKMAEIFGGKASDYEDIDEKVIDLLADLRLLGEAGQQAAESIEAQFGVSAVSQLTKALQAAQRAEESFLKVEQSIDEYLGEDFTVDGERAAYKISKALRDWRNADIKVDQKVGRFGERIEKDEKEHIMRQWADEHPQASWDTDGRYQQYLAKEYWRQYKESRIKELKEQAQQEKNLNAANTREKIRGYAQLIFNDQMGDYDLTNWNDKTIAQISEIRAAIANVELPEDVKKELEDNVELAQMLVEELGKIKKQEGSKADKAATDEWAQGAQRVAKYLGKAAEYMERLGEATGSEAVSDLAVGLGALSENLQAAGEGYAAAASAGAGAYAWIGAVVGGIGDITAKIIDSVAEATEVSRREMEQFREDMRRTFSEGLTEGVETAFGDNLIQKLRNANKELRQLEYNLGLVAGQGMSGMGIKTLTRKSGFLNIGRTDFSLQDAANATGISLLKNGILNTDLLRAIQEMYVLDEKSQEWISTEIINLEAYSDVLKTFDELMENLFGNVAASAADSIIDGWIEAGNAALDYADILDDVAKSYAKMLIQSTILDEVFTQDEINKIKALFVGGDYQGAMAAIAEDMEAIAGLEPVFQNILEAFDPYFNKEGNDGTLANGINGITEDTANLLASYLNAIRADVSMMRLLAQQGWSSVSNIADAIGVLPTLNDHIMKIAAHNANIEQSTRQILVELQGVIVNEGSGRGFRSYPA
jgi:hypothetical protein